MTPLPLRTLLIDDEAPARADLRRLLAAHPDITITGEAGRLAEARAALARDDYDLVLLDVELRGGTGFELVPLVRPGARIIFVTAFDQYAIRAFAVNALDYLLKPVEPARLADSLRRLAAPARPTGGDTRWRLDDSIYVKTDTDAARFVALRELLAVFSSENYTELRLAGGTGLVVRRTLKSWEEQLPADHFMRVHRTAVVNLHAVVRSTHVDRETTHLFLAGLDDSQPVRARREYWPDIERRLGRLKS